jgi:hypothetical protein
VRPLAPSRVDACNPLLQAHPTWARDKHEGRGIPPLTPRLPPAPSPLRAPSRADPSGLGHATIIYSSVQGPPGFETPTVGTPGRGLLRVDEQLPVKLQMGSLQQPFQSGTVLRFGSLEFMSLDCSYDMILLPPPRDSDNGGRQPARRRRNRRRLPHVAEEQHSSSPRRLCFDQDQRCSILPGSHHKLWKSSSRRWMSTSGLIMSFGREGKRPTDTPR